MRPQPFKPGSSSTRPTRKNRSYGKSIFRSRIKVSGRSTRLSSRGHGAVLDCLTLPPFPAPFKPVPVRAFLAAALLLTGKAALAQSTSPAPATPPANTLEAALENSLGNESVPGDARPTLRARALNCPTALAAPYGATRLQVGLYWYGPGQPDAPGGVGCRARPDGAAMPGYYDPARPVILFVHGWQPRSVQKGLVPPPAGRAPTQSTRRENFWFAAAGQNVADAWLAAGWNVGLYHWTQLADDESVGLLPYNAQAKLWTASYSYTGAGGQPVKVGMRFSTPAGYTLTGAPRKPVGALFYDAYRSALSRWTYAGPEPVRVLGHSLGAQLTLALAEQAYADPALPPRQRPARLVLADPYWTPATPGSGHGYGYLAPDANPAARSARIAAAVSAAGAVIEWVKSSAVLDLGGDNNAALLNTASRAELLPEFIPAVNGSARHDSAPRWYLSTLTAPNGAVSAAHDLNTARTLMNLRVPFVQTRGAATPDPADDRFGVPGP